MSLARTRRLDRFVALAAMILVLASSSFREARGRSLPPPAVPPENPITDSKAVLGKILFWDEQLSSDNTIACGSCHLPRFGSGDPRSVRIPGPDGIPGSDDDTFGSPGVARSTRTGHYRPDVEAGFAARITPRLAPNVLTAAYDDEIFWDGRAGARFIDPATGEVILEEGGALESQSLQPLLNPVEMAYEGRTWDDVIAKIEGSTPLGLATDLPPDTASAIAAHPTYPELYDDAFGSGGGVTLARTAMALATYLRTLVPDQSPFDRNGLSASEEAGKLVFQTKNCTHCHRGRAQSDHEFHNTGIRPAHEDVGRMAVTGDSADIGRFKTPSLRNVGLRTRLTHAGTFGSLEEIVDFYDRGGDFHEHQDPAMAPLGLTSAERSNLIAFLRSGLTDPRVANAQHPFDRPTLRSEIGSAVELGVGHPGSGDRVPQLLATSPLVAGAEFRLGIHDALGGARSLLAVSRAAASDGRLVRGVPLYVSPASARLVERTLRGEGPGAGYATVRPRRPLEPRHVGREVFAQWFVLDPEADQGVASTAAVAYEVL